MGFVVLFAWAQHMANFESPYDATKAQLMLLEMQIRSYHLDTQTLPRALDDLMLPPAGIRGWNGPYAKSPNLVDLRGRPIGYEIIDAVAPKFRLFTSEAKGAPAYSETYSP